MIRLIAIMSLFATIGVVAFRNWYYALCGLAVATVLTQHPDMPTMLFGIPGMNPWNAALACILLARLLHMQHEHGRAPTGPWLKLSFASYAGLILVAGFVGALDHAAVKGEAAARLDFRGFLIDCIINPMKYLVLGVLFYSATVTPARVRAAILAATGSGILYALLMFKTIHLRVFTINFEDARRLTDKLVGLYATDLAQLFAFTIWAAVLATPLVLNRLLRAVWVTSAIATALCFISLKARGAFIAFLSAGLALGVLRSRRLLVLLPLCVLGAIWWDPTVVDRTLTGVGSESHFDDTDLHDWDEISAGRITGLWPPTINQILKAPVLGHGRYAILREDVYNAIVASEGSVPSHPHNAYLEILLDAGVVGLAVCTLLLATLTVASLSLMQAHDARLARALGSITFVAVVIVATSSLTSQSFYLTQSMVPYACFFGTALRVWTERRHATATAAASRHQLHHFNHATGAYWGAPTQ
ncbi:MAG: O-antigen ligase family protein [Candidatus Rokuibacteriota bacterium]